MTTNNKIKDMEEGLFKYTRDKLFGSRKQKTLEEAFEKYLKDDPEEEDNRSVEDEWF